MRRLAICLGLVLSLAPAGAASAKEPVKATVCGASGCETVKDRSALMALNEGGPPTQPPAGGADWYEVVVTIKVGPEQHDSFPLAIAPSERLMRSGDAEAGYTWAPLSTRAVREYRRVTDGIAPFPASTLEGIPPAAPASRPEPAAQDGGASPLPWIAGGLVLLGLAAFAIRRRGLPWPKPA